MSLQTVAQEDGYEGTGYPGEQLDPGAVLDLFKKSASPEDFENKLNTASYGVNNLDLDEDGDTDYIHVDEYIDGEVHLLVLRAYLSEKEVQDVATIEIEKTGGQQAMIQFVGDETVYGGRVIYEPFETVEKEESEEVSEKTRVPYNREIVNVWTWPAVVYIYRPGYKVWRSPWRWRYYPVHWRPWRPLGHEMYYNQVFRHRSLYRTAPMRRVVVAKKMYKPHRKSSSVVKKRTTVIRKSRGSTKAKRTVTRSRRN